MALVTGGRVIVVGSVNVDLVATVERLPVPGQTVTGATTILNPAPAAGLAIDAIRASDLVVPNEGELAELLTALDDSSSGDPPPRSIDVAGGARRLLAASSDGTHEQRSIIVTLGAQG